METIKQRDVSTAQDLIAVVRDRSVDRIVVSGDLAGLSSLELLPDQALTAAARATLQFKDGSDGIRLSSNNKLENLTLIAAPEKRAIFNDTTVADQIAKAVVKGKLTIPIVARMALKDASEAPILISKGANGEVLLVP